MTMRSLTRRVSTILWWILFLAHLINPFSLSAISMHIPNWLQFVHQGYVNDSSLSKTIQRLANDHFFVPHYSWDGASLRYKGHLVFPQITDIQQVIFYEIHASPSVGHSTSLNTYERAHRNFFWKGMKREIQ